MVVAPITRPGQTNGTGDANSLFLRIFSGEVLSEFHRKNLFMPLHTTRTISNAKSATFPVTGTATAAYHVAGESVYGTDNAQVNTYLSNIKVKEREIFIDDPIVSGVFVPKIDQLKVHWDARSVFVKEIGAVLAETADKNIVSTIAAAALTAPSFNLIPNAERQVVIADATVGANIESFATKVAQSWDTYNIPKEDRYLVLRPKQYYIVAALKDLYNRDWNRGDNGSYADRQLMTLAGMKVIMSNAVGTTNEQTGYTAVGEKNDPFGGSKGYKANWTTIGALAFHPSCIGTVKLADMSTETEHSVERRGDLILSSYAMGHNVLRAECAAVMVSTTI